MTTTGEATAIVAMQQVLGRYCRSMDRMDADLTLGCFEPDALLEYQRLFRGTPAEFVAWLWPVHASLVAHTHQIHNSVVDFTPDGAVSETYVTVTLRAAHDGEEGGGIDLIGRGRYLDEWAEAGGRWTIRRRRYVSDLTTVVVIGDLARFGGSLVPAVEDPPSFPSRRDRDDVSYLLSGWAAR